MYPVSTSRIKALPLFRAYPEKTGVIFFVCHSILVEDRLLKQYEMVDSGWETERRRKTTMKIYTGTGDKGKTSLFSGERIEKSHDRVEAYGNVDELNANLGVLAASLPEKLSGLAGDIRQIQKTLFYIGSWMATTADSSAVSSLVEIGDDRISFLENAIDEMQASLPELKGFILPGGSQPAAFAHVARTVCRRAERQILKLLAQQGPEIDEDQFKQICVFVNRLSDFLFMAARYINNKLGVADQLSKDA